MNSPQPELPELVRQLSWTQASLDLCLDMERNQSDSWFAAQSLDNEIIYVFDESVFELFIGGFDEPRSGSHDDNIYSDRRRSVGIFNVREWREKLALDDAHERSRISLNRQAAILTTEWLFAGTLPSMGHGRKSIYISRGHLQELRVRWEALATYYRKLARSNELATKERSAVKALLADRAALALGKNDASTIGEVSGYISQQHGELKSDLLEFWSSLSSNDRSDESSKTRSFWRYAFSRRLAAELADIRAIGPLAQLVRINTTIAGRLRLLEHAGEIDVPPMIPSSERRPFWKDRIDEEIDRRRKFGLRVERSVKTRNNDAATLALVQALANTAVRQNVSKRYVFVTVDSVIIEAYRRWHCHSALETEPFVIRPVRHFAPLLNVASMADEEADSSEETREKRDIFPALQAAINPFLLTLNLSRRAFKKSSPTADDDSTRWPREMFALHLRRILLEYRRSADASVRGNEKWLRSQIADMRFFSGAHLERLKDADMELRSLSDQGRLIERTAIGLGLPRLGAKLDGLKVVADVLDNLIDRDETALAAYIQDMVDDFGSANLMLQARSLSITDDLQSIVASDEFAGLSPIRVPLTLDISFVEDDRTLSIEAEALRLVDEAVSETGRPPRGGKRRIFDLDLRGSSLASDGGHRLFSLFACIALRLGRWDTAQRHAAEAHYRVGKFRSNDLHDQAEVSYLLALTMRFQIGAGTVLDATGFDITEKRFEDARELLRSGVGDRERLSSFRQMRAASELAALEIFVSVWSLTRDRRTDLDHPRLGSDLHSELLLDAWRLTSQLRAAMSKLFPDVDGRASEKDVRELYEQMVTNGSAIVALAYLAHRSGDDRMKRILDDTDLTTWLDHTEPKRPDDRALPPITDFYRHWYLRFRKPDLNTSDARFFLDLPVDLAAQQLFQLAA